MHVVFGNGPVGRALTNRLRSLDEPVRVVSRSGPNQPLEGVDYRSGDASNAEFARDVAEGAAVVYQVLNPPYHRWPQEFPGLQRSVVGGAQAADARYVSFENLYMYGSANGEPITEQTPENPHTRKGQVRLEMASELHEMWERGDLAVATARASDYYGPGATWQSPLGERVMGRALQGKSAQVVGDPSTRHSYSYVLDIGVVLAMLGREERAVGEVWHVPNAPARSTEEIIHMVAGHLGEEISVSKAPEPVLRFIGIFNPAARELIEMLYEFKEDFVADGRRFADEFGVEPTPLEKGIEESVLWWRERAPRGSSLG